MRSLGMRGVLIGAALVVVVGAVSASALVFQGRDDTSSSLSSKPSASATTRRSTTTTTTSTSTTSSTTSTTTTTAPPPPPTEPQVTAAPAPTAAEAPAPAFTPPPAPAASFCDGSGSAVISAMNGDRGAGLGALCGNGQLQGIAQNWANSMAQHASLTHQDLGAALGTTSFSAMAENILEGPGGMSVDQMEASWMGSAPHRANILSGAYSAAGVGIAYSSDGRVWVVVDFGG